MIIRSFTLLILLALPVAAAANAQQQQIVDWAKVHSLTASAIDSLYSMKFMASEKICDELIGMAPGDPRGHFFKAMNAYYQYALNRGASVKGANYDRFMRLTQNVVKVCERLLDRNENDSKAMFYMGGILGYRGLAKFTNEELTSAMWDGKKGYDLLEKAIEADSANYDAKLGFGLFNYLISNAPSYLKPALKLAGLGGDRITGLKMLEAAAARGTYSQTEARSWLADFYSSEENTTRANLHLSALVKKYPVNWWYQQRYGWLLLNQLRRADDAVEHYARAQTAAADNKPSVVRNAVYYIGLARVYSGEYDKAAAQFRQLLGDTTGFGEAANYYMGIIEEIAGNRKAALEFYEKAGNTGNAPQLLKTPMTKFEIAQQKADFSFRAGRYDAAITLAEATLADPALPNDDTRAQLLYTCGRAYNEKGNYTKANEQFEMALAVPVRESPWLQPFVCYRNGMCLAKAGNPAKAKEVFRKALEYDDFPQKEYLRRRVNIELARLK